jgi:hypothetical protein
MQRKVPKKENPCYRIKQSPLIRFQNSVAQKRNSQKKRCDFRELFADKKGFRKFRQTS